MTTALRASDSSTRAALPARNPGTPLDLVVPDAHADQPQRRRAPRRDAPDAPHGEEGVAGGLAAAGHHLMDLTTLSGDDTAGNVRRLCAKARQPVRDDLLEALGVADRGIHVGAVCVYHALRADGASRRCAGTGIPGRGGLDRLPGRPSRRSTRGSRRSARSVAAGADGDRHRHHARATC